QSSTTTGNGPSPSGRVTTTVISPSDVVTGCVVSIMSDPPLGRAHGNRTWTRCLVPTVKTCVEHLCGGRADLRGTRHRGPAPRRRLVAAAVAHPARPARAERCDRTGPVGGDQAHRPVSRRAVRPGGPGQPVAPGPLRRGLGGGPRHR